MRRDVARSKKLIRDAYIHLCMTTPTEQITVKEILGQADVSRGTFYAHFRDVYDLREQVEEELLGRWRRILTETRSCQSDPHALIMNLLDFFTRHRPELACWNEAVFHKVKDIMVKALCEDDALGDYDAAVCIAGVIVDQCRAASAEPEPRAREVIAGKTAAFIEGGLTALRAEQRKKEKERKQ